VIEVERLGRREKIIATGYVAALFSFFPLVTVQHKTAEALQGRVERLSVIRGREGFHEPNQVRIAGDHKGGDGDVKPFALHGQIEAAIDNFAIDSERIFVIFFTNFKASGLAVGNHKNLFVRIPAALEDIHGELQSGNRIGVVGADFEVRNIFEFDGPGVVAEDDEVEGILGETGFNKFSEGERLIARGLASTRKGGELGK
jgi:hypothetical protein